MNAHTPGPWTRSTERSLTIDGPKGSDDWQLAVAHVAERTDREQAIADARLIAAAPDMLAALKTAKANLVDGTVRAPKGLWEQIDAAIAKATGEVA